MARQRLLVQPYKFQLLAALGFLADLALYVPPYMVKPRDHIVDGHDQKEQVPVGIRDEAWGNKRRDPGLDAAALRRREVPQGHVMESEIRNFRFDTRRGVEDHALGLAREIELGLSCLAQWSAVQ